MALINCHECSEEISDSAAACPKCGAKVPKFKWWLWIPLGLLAAFFGYGIVASSSPEAEEKAKARAAIAHCWDGYEAKSLAPGEQRFIAGACELMEQEFLTKYGFKP